MKKNIGSMKLSHRYFEGDKNFQRIKTDGKWLPVNIQCIKLMLVLSK